MYLIPDSVATKQLSGSTESPSKPSPSKPSPCKTYQSPADASKSPYSKSPASSRRRYYSSDEEDDSRDRQSHWKRIKVRTDDNPKSSSRNRITYTESDRRSYATSPTFRRPQGPSRSVNPLPGPRVIVLKRSLHEKDVGMRRSSCESEVGIHGSGSKGWDVAVRSFRDGGTASKDIDPVGTKRKYETEVRKSSMMMLEQSMVIREKHMARRVPIEREFEGGYEFRVSGREVGEFNGENGSSLFLEDSRQFNYEDSERPRVGLDLREALNRRSRRLDSMSREIRGYGDQKSEPAVRVKKVEFDVSTGNGKGSLGALQGSGVRKVLDLGRSSRSGNDESKSFALGGISHSTADVGTKVERDMESERREKRERWAEKERDLEKELQEKLQKELEKENMPRPQPKPVAVVDYSHKFTVAKAPISAPTKQVEMDPHRLCQRQKQIDYGKNTLGYERYIEMVPRYKRTKSHPRTPDIRQVCSKRSWDGQIRKWRRLLHEYDPPKGEDEEDSDQVFVPTRDLDNVRGSHPGDDMIDMQSDYVEDTDMKIYDGWSDEEC